MNTAFQKNGCRINAKKFYPVPLSGKRSDLFTFCLVAVCLLSGAYIIGFTLYKGQMIVDGYKELWQDFTWSGFLVTTAVVSFILGVGSVLLWSGCNMLAQLIEKWGENRLRKNGYSRYGLYFGSEWIEYRSLEDTSFIKRFLFGRKNANFFTFPLQSQFSKEQFTGGMAGGSPIHFLRIDFEENGVKGKKVLEDFVLEFYTEDQKSFLNELNALSRGAR